MSCLPFYSQRDLNYLFWIAIKMLSKNAYSIESGQDPAALEVVYLAETIYSNNFCVKESPVWLLGTGFIKENFSFKVFKILLAIIWKKRIG